MKIPSQGTLKSAAMPALLNAVYAQADAFAVLDIAEEPIRKRFYFKDGLPVGASSNVLGEVLGRLLLAEGVITEKNYEDSLETVQKEKKRHGDVLVSMGLLTPERLESFLVLQLKRRLWNVFGWEDGTYRYSSAAALPEHAEGRPVNPMELMLEGFSLGFYPLARMNEELREYLDAPVLLSPKAGDRSLSDLRLTIQEKRFVESIDGVKTLKEALDSCELLRQRALSLSLMLVMAGFLARFGDKERGPGGFEPSLASEAAGADSARRENAPVDARLGAELMFRKAKLAVASGDLDSAVETLREITGLNPAEAEYRAWLGWAVHLSGPGRAREGAAIIREALEINPALDAASQFLGMILAESGDEKGAVEAFKAALSSNPLCLDAVRELKRMEIKRSLGPEDGGRAAYMEFFGFDEDPLTGAPDERFLHLSECQQEVAEALVKAVRLRSGAALVEGMAGAGKSALVLELLSRLRSERVMAAVILDPPSTEKELVKAINVEAGAATEGPSIKELLLALGLRITQNKTSNAHTVIVIDNAHKLTDGCLKLVQYMTRLKSMQIVLFSDISISERLKDPAFLELGQKISTRLFLNRLTPEETRAFIFHRIGAARKRADRKYPAFLLTDAELKQMYLKTLGAPADILKETAAIMLRFAEAKGAEKEASEPEPREPSRTSGAGPGGFEFTTNEPEAPAVQPTAEAINDAEERITSAATPPAQEMKFKTLPPRPVQPEAKPKPPSPGPRPGQVAAPQKKSGNTGRLILLIILLAVTGAAAASYLGYLPILDLIFPAQVVKSVPAPAQKPTPKEIKPKTEIPPNIDISSTIKTTTEGGGANGTPAPQDKAKKNK